MFSLDGVLAESKQRSLRRRCSWAHEEAKTSNNNADDKGQNLLQNIKIIDPRNRKQTTCWIIGYLVLLTLPNASSRLYKCVYFLNTLDAIFFDPAANINADDPVTEFASSMYCISNIFWIQSTSK